ncbi:MAG: PAS domain-containing protein [Bacteroidota bacterium]
MSKEEDRIKALEKKVKSLEKQVKQTERQSKKYKALFENAPLGLFRADESGTLLDINLSMAQILGYRSIKSALNDLCNLSNFIPDFSGLLSELKHKSRHGDRLYTFQKQLKKKGNILIEVNLTIKVLTDAQKDLKYLEGFIENITKRKETEQKLIVERNQLRAVIDNIPDFIYVKNLEGQYILANKILSRWVKSISGEKVIGNYDRNIFPEQVAKEFIEDDNLVFDNQKIINKDEQRLGDFSNIAIYTTKIPLKDDGNKIIGVVGISRNLTDLKTAQEKIRSSQTNLKAVIESTSNAIWSVDRDYNLIEGNTAFKKIFTALFGLKVRSGQNILKSLPDNEKITWKSYYDAAFKGNQWHEELSYDINCERYQFNVTFNPIYSASKKITGATVFAQDISLRKKAEAKVRESEVTFKQFADNTSDAFLMLENNRVIYSNPGFKIIYGRDVKQNINPDEFHLQWIHPQDKTRIKRKLISKQ